MERPKLRAVEVPWCMMSDPALRLHFTDFEQLRVEFRAHFFPASIETYGQDEHDMLILFNGMDGVRINPGMSDGVAIDRELFDWSKVIATTDFDASQYNRTKFFEVWKTTGKCPYPGMYEIEGGDWITSNQLSQGLRHYIFIGEQSTIEILGKDWIWKLKE